MILDKRKVRKDGNYPLYFQICYSRKTTTRSTKISIHETFWNEDKKEIKKSHPEAKYLNQKLKKTFADIQSELLLADEDKLSDYLKPNQPVVKVEKPIRVEIKTV